MGSATAPDGFYIAGTFGDEVVVNGADDSSVSLTSSGSAGFLARYASDGALIWARVSGGDFPVALAYGANAIAVTGRYEAGATFGAGEAAEVSFTGSGAFLALYGDDGALLWAKRLALNAGPQAVAVGANGAITVAGEYNNFSDGGTTVVPDDPESTGLPTSQGDDTFVARLDADGTLLWVRRADGTGSQLVTDISAAADGGVVMTGRYSGATRFGEGEQGEVTFAGSAGIDVFLARYRSDGTVAWATRASGAGNDDPTSVAPDGAGGVYLVGAMELGTRFGENEQFDTQLNGPGTFVARFDQTGQVSWAIRATDSSVFAMHVAATDTGAVVTGFGAGPGTLAPDTPAPIVFGNSGDPHAVSFAVTDAGIVAEHVAVSQTRLVIANSVAVTSDGSWVMIGDFGLAALTVACEPSELTLTAEFGFAVFLASFAP